MRIGGERERKKEKKRERCELSVATANGMCDTRVLLLHDEAALSPVIRELFCQSVRSLSAAFADEPTNRPYVRLLWLLTRDLRAMSPLARLTPRVKRSVYHTRKHAAATSASITVASVRVALTARPYGCVKPRGTSG